MFDVHSSLGFLHGLSFAFVRLLFALDRLSPPSRSFILVCIVARTFSPLIRIPSPHLLPLAIALFFAVVHPYRRFSPRETSSRSFVQAFRVSTIKNNIV